MALISEHVALKPKGREHVGLCPFHDDRSPSLAVVTHKGNAFYKCFACGAAGNAIDFVMNFHKMPFPEALRFLAAKSGLELRDRFEERDPTAPRKDDLLRANQLALKFFRRMLADETEGTVARATVSERRIAPAMVEAFQLGYAPDRRDALQSALSKAEAHAKATGREAPPSRDAFREAGLFRDGRGGTVDLLRHRIVFPICDELGRPIAFGGRKIRSEDEPKYINSPETPLFHKGKSLYGLHLAKQSIVKQKVAIVTEGYTDVIACHEAGFTNVVATLGTALTREHAKVLRRLCEKVILLFDGDAAGIRAAERGVEVFFGETIDVAVCTLPDDLDPDELLREPEGPATFARCLEGAIDALAFLVQRFRREYAAKQGLSGRQQALEALLRKLAELGFSQLSGVRRRFVLASLADLTGLSERELEAALPTIRPTQAARASETAPAADTGEANTRADEVPLPIGRARREAERHLLAFLLAHPEQANTMVTIEVDGDGSESGASTPVRREQLTMPLVEACAPEHFRDPLHAEVYRTWRELLDTGTPATIQSLMAELAQPRAKSLASDLFVLGESRRGPGGDRPLDPSESADLLRHAFSDLERLARRERDRSSDQTTSIDTPSTRPPLDLADVHERFRRLRERGLDVTAVPRSGAVAPRS